MTGGPVLRVASSADGIGSRLQATGGWRLEPMVLERDGLVVAAAGVDAQGPPTDTESPRVVMTVEPTASEDDVDALLRRLTDEADRAGLSRLLAGCDPMDLAMIRRLERAGFRPTGTAPYVELGGGLVEYVAGYQGATGSTMDLARTAADR